MVPTKQCFLGPTATKLEKALCLKIIMPDKESDRKMEAILRELLKVVYD